MIYNYHDMNLACVKNKSSLGHAIQSSLRGGGGGDGKKIQEWKQETVIGKQR